MKKPSDLIHGLDHLAIVVPDTDEALRLWRDQLGFPVIVSEAVNNETVRLTHLDLGNTHLQLVEPLTPDHPLQGWLAEHGPGLHHFCFRVDDVGQSMLALADMAFPAGQATPHQGTEGKRAAFLDRENTANILVEITGA